MTPRYARLAGWGYDVPARVVTNDDLAALVDTSDEWIYARSGIRERRFVGAGETTLTMATAAARAALDKAALDAAVLDLVIVATSSPDYLTPPISSQVQDALGAHRAGAFQMAVGCTGFVYALVTAQQFIASGACDTVLVVGAEVISRWLDFTDRATCVLFGDGAGAVVLQAAEEPCGVLGHVLGSDGSGKEHIIVPAGGTALPPTRDTLARRLHFVRMNGREVFKFATRTMVRVLHEALDRADLTPADIDLFIPHQANVRIIDYAAQQLGLPPDKVFVNIERYGNMSAASVPVALCEALDQGRARAGDTLALVAFGAGLTWASCIFHLGVARPVDAPPGPAMAASA